MLSARGAADCSFVVEPRPAGGPGQWTRISWGATRSAGKTARIGEEKSSVWNPGAWPRSCVASPHTDRRGRGRPPWASPHHPQSIHQHPTQTPPGTSLSDAEVGSPHRQRPGCCYGGVALTPSFQRFCVWTSDSPAGC